MAALLRQLQSVWKATQRQCFTWLSSKYGIGLCVVGLFLTIISAFHFGESVLSWSRHSYEARFGQYSDNIAGHSFQERLCSPTPVDVVYTWVNGSDPTLKTALAAVRLEYERRKNETLRQEKEEREAKEAIEKARALNGTAATNASALDAKAELDAIADEKETAKQRDKSVHTISSPERLLVTGLHELSAPAGTRLHAVREALEACGNVSNLALDVHEVIGMVQFASAAEAAHCQATNVSVEGAPLVLSTAALVGNSSLDGLVQLNASLGFGEGYGFATLTFKTAMLVRVPPGVPDSLMRSYLQQHGELEHYARDKAAGVVVVAYEHRWPLVSLMDDVEVVFERSTLISSGPAEGPGNATLPVEYGPWQIAAAGVLQANLSNPVTVPIISCIAVGAVPGGGQGLASFVTSGSEFDAETEEVSSSRFQDNSELQYSLRSIEQNAPWVRNIYVVTNGQIPSWLNLDHPRIQVIPHDDLFHNKSHLPTFSSPAIETHLHRIPGLSKKFIYLNDDVMFGKRVWPDDFYSHARGQKVYLAWPVPNCAEGCPSNWIGDKYCDAACNNPECDYDGTDCIEKNKEDAAHGDGGGGGGGGDHGNAWSFQDKSSTKRQYCSTTCADSWMGDKYCDNACNVRACGFDSGDCGMNVIRKQLPGHVLNRTTEWIHQDIAEPTRNEYPLAIFVEVNVHENATITGGTHNNREAIASAVVSKDHGILTVVFRKGLNQTSAAFNLTLEVPRAGESALVLHHAFNVSINTGDVPAELILPAQAPDDAVNGSIANVSVVDGRPSVNFWDVVDLQPITLPDPREQREEAAKDNQTAMPAEVAELQSNTSSLPGPLAQEVLSLQQQLKDGDITQKGYLRFCTKLLSSYLAGARESLGVMDNSSNARAHHRQGRQLLSNPGPGHNPFGARHPVQPLQRQPLGAFVLRNGHKVAVDQAQLADWIADQKRKQVSFEDDMRSSVEAWEQHTGRRWSSELREQELAKVQWYGRSRRRDAWAEERPEAQIHAPHGADMAHMREASGARWRSRSLKDTFGDSLKYVNRLYNHHFGFAARKVIAHMPHFLDRDILEELEATFPAEWNLTSSHQLRASDDLQYAFAYYYFLMSVEVPFNATEHFDELDTDRDGILSVQELRTLVTRIFDLPTSSKDWTLFEDMLLNCSSLQPALEQLGVGVGPNAQEVWVTKTLFAGCEPLLEKLKDKVGKEHKYRFELESDEHDIAFQMIGNNASHVTNALDSIRRSPQKFVCLNDNIDHRRKTAPQVVKALHSYYESMYPLRSQFELPSGYRNRFLHMHDLRAWHGNQLLILKWSKAAAVALFIVFVAVMYSGSIRNFRRRWLQSRHRQRTTAAVDARLSGSGQQQQQWGSSGRGGGGAGSADWKRI